MTERGLDGRFRGGPRMPLRVTVLRKVAIHSGGGRPEERTGAWLMALVDPRPVGVADTYYQSMHNETCEALVVNDADGQFELLPLSRLRLDSV